MTKPETEKTATAATTTPAPAPIAESAAVVDGRTDYRVTAAAGPKVAGQRVKAGQKIRLSDAEALGEIASGAIVAWNRASKPA